MTLTIDQLRAYLERREREASAARDVAFHWHAYTVARVRHEVYRELLEAIESGVLPE